MAWNRFNPLRLLRRKAATTAYPLPYTGGSIPVSWPSNWWQQGRNPIGGGSTVTVQACADAYAHTMGALIPYHYRVDERGTREYIETSALARVLYSPNSYQTRSDFMLNLIKNLMIYGNAYAVGVRDGRNEFSSMHIVPSNGTMPYIEPDSKSIYYAVGNNPLLGDIENLIPQRDMMHIRLYCPRHPLIGITPIEHAAASIAANAAISAHQAAFFQNMSRPSGILRTDEKMTADQMKQLRAAWDAQAKDMETGGVPILGSGLEWNQMTMNSVDAQLVQAFSMTTVDIARAFRVPLPLIQQHDQGSTYNNVEQLYNQWLAGGLGFIIEHVEQNFSAFFGLTRKEGTEFDTESLLRTDFQAKVEGYTKLVQGGILTPNEGRTKVGGLPPVDHGDDAYMQQQMVPLGWTAENDVPVAPAALPAPAAEPPEDPEAEDEKSFASIYYLRKAVGHD